MSSEIGKLLDAQPHAQRDSSLRVACRIAKLGGWDFSPKDQAVTWSDETALLHDEPAGFSLTMDAALRYYAPESVELIRRAVAACASDGTPFDLEAAVITAKGRRIWVRAMGEAVRDAAGEVVLIQGAFQDISDQKAAADQLLTLARRLHDTLETITDAFFILGPDWTFVYLNAAAERLVERTRAELLGRNIWEEFKEAVGTTADLVYHRVLAEQVAVNFEQFYPPLNRWFEAKAYPAREGVAVYFRDITVRRAAEKRIQEQAMLLDKATDAILVRDLDHRILYWNRSAERIYGWKADEVVGRSVKELLYVDPVPFLVAVEATLLRGEWVGELEQKTKDAQTRTMECRWTLVRDDDGAPRSILAINSDISQRKRIEGQLLRAQRLQSIGSLAGGIAHDLNNTLAPILMTVSLLTEGEPEQSRRDDLATIASCAQRAAEMVQQLLSFARGADGPRTRTDVGKIAAEIQTIVKDTFPKGIVFRLALPEQSWEVNADPTQLHQLLMNLCVNARDAMPHGGLLTVAVEHIVLDDVYAGMNAEAKAGPYVLLRVEDGGSGMSAEMIDRVFDPFFTTKQSGHGTGLGLSTVHTIVRSHGGFIHVYSEVGVGTRFKVYLPAEGVGAAREGSSPSVPNLPRGNGELILVVDDEEMIRTVARRTLERFGYRVALASNGAEAVSRYAQSGGEIAVVLTDMSMPVMDGPATIVALRTLNPKVRIIASSGLSGADSPSRVVGAAVEHFVPKPYTADVLLSVLKSILSEPA